MNVVQKARRKKVHIQSPDNRKNSRKSLEDSSDILRRLEEVWKMF